MIGSRDDGKTVAAFRTWLQSVDIEYNEECIRIEGDSPGTLSIVALQDIEEGATLAKIPKDACITIYTTALSDILADEGLAGGLGVVIAVWYEKGIGASSRWAGYFESMRDSEYLPIFWTEKELDLLEGSEIRASDVESDKQDVMDDYTHHVIPLMETYRDVFGKMSDTSVESFVKTASLVASRAFGVDGNHGDGMVPLADVFNHKVSVVELTEEYTIHGAESSSSDTIDGHDEEENIQQKNGNEHGSESSSCSSPSPEERGDEHGGSAERSFPRPCANGAGGLPERCGMSQANGLDLRLHIAIIDDDEHDCLHIVAASALHKGKEVFNTYGELGNSELVKKYGFVVRENPFTHVTLRKSTIFEYINAMLPPTNPRKKQKGGPDDTALLKAIFSIIEEQTELLNEADDEEPFLIYPGGHVSLSIYTFIYILILGLCGVDINDIEQLLEFNAELVTALDTGVPTTIQLAIERSIAHIPDSASPDKRRIDTIVRVCVDAFVASARERQDALTNAPSIQSNSKESSHGEATAMISILRCSERDILNAFIRLAEHIDE